MGTPDQLGGGSLMPPDGGAPADVTLTGLERAVTSLHAAGTEAGNQPVDVIGTEEFWAIPESADPSASGEADTAAPVAKLVDIKKVPLFVEEDVERYREVRSVRKALAARRRDRREGDRRQPAQQRLAAAPEAPTEPAKDPTRRPEPFARYMGSRLTEEERRRADEALARDRYERRHPEAVVPEGDSPASVVEDLQIAS